MRWFSMSAPGIWLMPASLGVLLILLGVLLYVRPELLAYFVAAIFILCGAGLLGVAWKLRAGVSYRRIDEDWRDEGSDER